MNKKALFAILIGHMICTSAYGVTCPTAYATDDTSKNNSASHILTWVQSSSAPSEYICSWEPDNKTADRLADCTYKNTNNLTIRNGTGCYGYHYEAGTTTLQYAGNCVRNYKYCDVSSGSDTNIAGYIFYDTSAPQPQWPSGIGTHCYTYLCKGNRYKYFYPDAISETNACGTNTAANPFQFGVCNQNPRNCSEISDMKTMCSGGTISGTYTFNTMTEKYDHSQCTCTKNNQTFSGWNGTKWTTETRQCSDIEEVNAVCEYITNTYASNTTCYILTNTLTKNLETNKIETQCQIEIENLPIHNGVFNIYLTSIIADNDIYTSNWEWSPEYTLQDCDSGYYVPDYNDENSDYDTNPDACQPVGIGYYRELETDLGKRIAYPIGSTTNAATSGTSIDKCKITGTTIFRDKNGEFSISNLDAQLAK